MQRHPGEIEQQPSEDRYTEREPRRHYDCSKPETCEPNSN